MNKKTACKILGVPLNASKEDIKKAYRTLAKKYHPDTNNSHEAKSKFEEVSMAYQALTSESFSNKNYDSLFDCFKDMYDKLMEEENKKPKRGANIRLSTRITFEESLNGVKKKIVYKKDGIKRAIQIQIPPGIDNGQNVCVKAKGEKGLNGGQTGDLIVNVSVDSHPEFTRQGNNIFSDIEVSYVAAVLGETISINTLNGPIAYKLNEGINNLSKIRLKGFGVKTKNKTGDHYVTIKVKVEKNISDKAKKLLLQYKEEIRKEVV